MQTYLSPCSLWTTHNCSCIGLYLKNKRKEKLLIYLVTRIYTLIHILFVYIYNFILYGLYMKFMYYEMFYNMNFNIFVRFLIIYKFFNINNEYKYVILRSCKIKIVILNEKN